MNGNAAMNRNPVINQNAKHNEQQGIPANAVHTRRLPWWTVPAVLLAVSIVLNAAAWQSRAFCNWYKVHIFPLWVETYGRLTGLAPFSVGEILIVIGIIWVLAALTVGIAAAVSAAGRHRNSGGTGQKRQLPERRRKFLRRFRKATAWMLSIVFLLMTLNCYVIWHADGLTEETARRDVQSRSTVTPDTVSSAGSAEEASAGRETWTAGQMAELRDYIVDRADTLAEQVSRDDDGSIVFEGDLKEEAIACMHQLSSENSQLRGYYPKPKGLLFSGLMSQAHMAGYYFPFSMEANYNTKMCTLNDPYTFCHELSHLKGYMKEDDCNMLAFLACIGSGDTAVQYSGWLGVLDYADNDFYESIGKDKAVYRQHTAISDQVLEDNQFLTEDTWKEVEQHSVVSTKTATEVTRNATDATIRANGISEGYSSYRLVVKQLLHWFFEEGGKKAQ